MYIKSQDGDVIFSLTDKAVIFTEDIYINGKFYGCNIYGRKLFRRYLLGTYEEDEATQVISEIFALLKAGVQYYSMPAPTMDISELGVSI